MTTGDLITWALAVVIFYAFWHGLKHIYRNFVSGESDCCGNDGSPACSCCSKEETTAKERKNAAEAWKAIRAEAREKRAAGEAEGDSCPACAARRQKASCPVCRARAKAEAKKETRSAS